VRLIAIFASLTLAASAVAADQTQLAAACTGYATAIARVTALHGAGKKAEKGVITAAQTVAEPICENPSATLDANAVADVMGAASQILDAVASIKARQTSDIPDSVAAHH